MASTFFLKYIKLGDDHRSKKDSIWDITTYEGQQFQERLYMGRHNLRRTAISESFPISKYHHTVFQNGFRIYIKAFRNPNLK
jgi:hypothetical protein